MMRRYYGVLISLAALGATACDQVAERGFQRAIERNVGRDRAEELPDGIHVFLCGTGSPFPDPTRAGPCLAVLAGDKALVFDAGSGSPRQLGSMAFPLGDIDQIFLTHLHSDHIDSLGELLLQSWIGGGRAAPTPVAGPRGTTEVVAGFNAAYRIDQGFRTAHHGAEIANPAGFGGAAREIVLEFDRPALVFDAGGVRVTAFPVNHAPVEPAFGYRIEYKDRSVVVSGDTTYDPRLVAVASGADLLVHEALDPEMVAAIGERFAEQGADNVATIMEDILDYHASPEDAARAASDAGVDRLVLTHIVPPLPSAMLYGMFLGEAGSIFAGPIDIGEDGLIYSLPASGDVITRIDPR